MRDADTRPPVGQDVETRAGEALHVAGRESASEKDATRSRPATNDDKRPVPLTAEGQNVRRRVVLVERRHARRRVAKPPRNNDESGDDGDAGKREDDRPALDRPLATRPARPASCGPRLVVPLGVT